MLLTECKQARTRWRRLRASVAEGGGKAVLPSGARTRAHTCAEDIVSPLSSRLFWAGPAAEDESVTIPPVGPGQTRPGLNRSNRLDQARSTGSGQPIN